MCEFVPMIEEAALPRVTEPPEKLLDPIYDAATEQELWSSALIQIADMTAASAASWLVLTTKTAWSLSCSTPG
jgi:hypothetical protein